MATQVNFPMTDAQRMAIEDETGLRLPRGPMNEPQRLAVEARIASARAAKVDAGRPQVSADARYIVQWMLGIFVLLPLIGVLLFALFR